MLGFKYICRQCGQEKPQDYRGMICPFCSGVLRASGIPGITGTRDNFGISKSFKNEDGKEIDNWKSWERAGYRKPLDVTRNHNVREKVKRKIDKINHENKVKVTI